MPPGTPCHSVRAAQDQRKPHVSQCIVVCDDAAHPVPSLHTAHTAMAPPPDPAASPDPLAAYPARLRHSTEHAERVYARAADRYALPEDAAAATAPPDDNLLTDDGRRLGLYRCAPGRAPPGAQAVYLEPGSGRCWVPSGRVFVRFVPTAQADSRRAALLQAGYRITAVLSYAPQAAWLEAADGGPAQALAGIARLEALAGMENVEPQWLAPRAAR